MPGVPHIPYLYNAYTLLFRAKHVIMMGENPRNAIGRINFPAFPHVRSIRCAEMTKLMNTGGQSKIKFRNFCKKEK